MGYCMKSFVHKLLLTAPLAFLDFNLAPPGLRRDIAILGFLHKRVLGQCHVAIKQLLPFIAPHPTWHDQQLESHIETCIARPTLFCRSLFGIVQQAPPRSRRVNYRETVSNEIDPNRESDM